MLDVNRRTLLTGLVAASVSVCGCLDSGPRYDLVVENRIDAPVRVELVVRRVASGESVISETFDLNAVVPNAQAKRDGGDGRKYNDRLAVDTEYAISVDVTGGVARQMSGTETFTHRGTFYVDIYNSGLGMGIGQA
jgi:hypothetical protein